MRVFLGESACLLRWARDLERIRSSMATSKLVVTFFAEKERLENACMLEPLSSECYKAILITSASTIPTPAGDAILSLTRPRRTPTAPYTCC